MFNGGHTPVKFNDRLISSVPILPAYNLNLGIWGVVCTNQCIPINKQCNLSQTVHCRKTLRKTKENVTNWKFNGFWLIIQLCLSLSTYNGFFVCAVPGIWTSNGWSQWSTRQIFTCILQGSRHRISRGCALYANNEKTFLLIHWF